MLHAYARGNKKQKAHKGEISMNWSLTVTLKLLWKERKQGASTAEGTEFVKTGVFRERSRV